MAARTRSRKRPLMESSEESSATTGSGEKRVSSWICGSIDASGKTSEDVGGRKTKTLPPRSKTSGRFLRKKGRTNSTSTAQAIEADEGVQDEIEPSDGLATPPHSFYGVNDMEADTTMEMQELREKNEEMDVMEGEEVEKKEESGEDDGMKRKDQDVDAIKKETQVNEGEMQSVVDAREKAMRDSDEEEERKEKESEIAANGEEEYKRMEGKKQFKGKIHKHGKKVNKVWSSLLGGPPEALPSLPAMASTQDVNTVELASTTLQPHCKFSKKEKRKKNADSKRRSMKACGVEDKPASEEKTRITEKKVEGLHHNSEASPSILNVADSEKKKEVLRRHFNSHNSRNNCDMTAEKMMNGHTEWFIDSHCHLDMVCDHIYFDSVDELLSHCASTHPATFRACIPNFIKPKMITKHMDWISSICQDKRVCGTTFGCHPHLAAEANARFFSRLREWAADKSKKMIAVGECGVDMTDKNKVSLERQLFVFEEHVKIAVELGLTLVIHCRPGRRCDPSDRVLEILSHHPMHPVHRHCFMGGAEEAHKWMRTLRHCSFGFTPGILTSSAADAAIKLIPADRILLETDAPYFKLRCFGDEYVEHTSHPGQSVAVAFRIAELKNLPVDEVIRCTRNATLRTYNLDESMLPPLPPRRSNRRVSEEGAMASGVDRNLYRVPNSTPIVSLDCKTAFANLSPKERLYAHHIAKASFDGALIVPLQVSPESAGIFVTLHRLFSSEPLSSLMKKAVAAGWTEEEWTNFIVYSASFFAYSGNYKSFGDTKFVPDVDPAKLSALAIASEAPSKFSNFLSTFHAVKGAMFSLNRKNVNLGFPVDGVTCYLGESVTRADTDLINRYFKQYNMEAWNSRLFKEVGYDGTDKLRVRLASSQLGSTADFFEGVRVVVEMGDYSSLLARASLHLIEASKHAANDRQKEMMLKYAKHFASGDINDHKDASRLWIKDVNPIVESYIGFIENYRDPAGVRSEFRGWVAAVNKEMSKKFSLLVKKAEEIIKRLPWGTDYEKDAFLRPDFTALDVIAFGSSGLPSGINVPNYDDIRQNEGFKNVSISNVISAMPKQKINFISNEDESLIFKYNAMAYEVQVGLHELLGHGSGKLFQKNPDGTFNFDRENTIDMITSKPVSSWYEPGETFWSVFGKLSCAYEECRAEAVGYVLCCDEDILNIFGYEGEHADTIKYVNWLSMILAGLQGLEQYSADAKKWGNAHCHARYALLKVVLEAGQGFVTIDEVTGEDGKPNLVFRLDKSKIDSVGRPAVTAFLAKLQAYKSTADVSGGSSFFNDYSSVGETELRWREICIARRQPRRIFVQPNTVMTSSGDVDLVCYEETPTGIINSFVDRYHKEAIDDLEELWRGYRKFFPKASAKV